LSSVELQRAIVGRLKADSIVDALIDGRVYDNPPPQPIFPYISIGPDNTIPSRADCYDGYEIHQQIDIWSRSPGFREAKQITEAARAALANADMTIADHRLVDIYPERVETMRDADGLTSHGILMIKALTEPVN